MLWATPTITSSHSSEQRGRQSQRNVSFFCAATTTKALPYVHVCTLYTHAHIHTRATVSVSVYVCMHVRVCEHCMCIVNAARSCHRFVCHAHTYTHMERTNLPRTHTIIARSLAYSHMHKYITERKKNFRPAWP